jgi:hypothetical protein
MLRHSFNPSKGKRLRQLALLRTVPKMLPHIFTHLHFNLPQSRPPLRLTSSAPTIATANANLQYNTRPYDVQIRAQTRLRAPVSISARFFDLGDAIADL